MFEMNSKILIAILSALISQLVSAQTFIKGDKCLMFGINGLNGISQSVSPVGSILYKKYKTDKKAKRIGLNFTNNESKDVTPSQWVEYNYDRNSGIYSYVTKTSERNNLKQSGSSLIKCC
jgi:hypothetical protein